MVQSECMANDAALTVRIPTGLKRQLEVRARQGHRSLSAQVLHDLEVISASSAPASTSGRFLGRFAGTPVPTDGEIRDVRARLWGRLTGSRDA